MTDSFKARATLSVGNKTYRIHSLAALAERKVRRLPFSLKILLENLLRFEDGVNVTKGDIDALLDWNPHAQPSHEIAFTRHASSCRTSPACRASWTLPQCARPSSGSGKSRARESAGAGRTGHRPLGAGG